jgi:hypothetical protein
MKKSSTSLVKKEMQNKIMLIFHLTLIRMTVVKKTSNRCWQGYWGKKNPYKLLVGCKLVQPLK